MAKQKFLFEVCWVVKEVAEGISYRKSKGFNNYNEAKKFMEEKSKSYKTSFYTNCALYNL